ncbi:MAG: GGDEF domain-containing protein [Lachnospiraceae bacterium]|nr:GGDEF domain-containing protein [Lachnospiraceae bacterium]
MENNNIGKKVYLDSRFYYCLVIVAFLFFALFYAFSHKNLTLSDTTSKQYDYEWYYADGSKVDFNNMKSDMTYSISHAVEKNTANNRSLCFYSKNVYFTVFVDDKAIYSFHPVPSRLLGKSYGIFPHSVSLPNLYEKSTLSISVENIYPETTGYIKGFTLGNGSFFTIHELQKTVPEFILCSIIFALGIVAFVIGVAGKYFGDKRYEIISMGAFAMVASVWIACETPFLGLLFSAPVAIHFVDYTMLALLPLPTILFAAFVTENRDSKVSMIIAFLSAGNLLVQILLTSFKIKDYHQMLFISHIILGITVVIVLALFIISLVKKKLKKEIALILTGTFSIALLMGTFEMIRYRMSPENYSGAASFRYVLFAFILFCCIYEFISISELSRKGQYAEIMEKIAYTDALTGLYNREAYNRYVDGEIQKEDSWTLVMLDMNNLKEVNDTFGHEVGDEYIKKLAEAINTAFEKNGNCYRMGGDEFLVISSLNSVDISFLESLDRLYSELDKFNSSSKRSIPLSVAVGYADYCVANGSIKEALREADVKMYERKKKMKNNE